MLIRDSRRRCLRLDPEMLFWMTRDVRLFGVETCSTAPALSFLPQYDVLMMPIALPLHSGDSSLGYMVVLVKYHALRHAWVD
jgi:hypothetical protein